MTKPGDQYQPVERELPPREIVINDSAKDMDVRVEMMEQQIVTQQEEIRRLRKTVAKLSDAVRYLSHQVSRS